MNLRVLKKDISFFTAEFVSDALLSLNFTQDSAKKDAVMALVNEALALEDGVRVRISHPEPEGPKNWKKGVKRQKGFRRPFYRSLYDSYFKTLDGLCTKLSETIHPKDETK